MLNLWKQRYSRFIYIYIWYKHMFVHLVSLCLGWVYAFNNSHLPISELSSLSFSVSLITATSYIQTKKGCKFLYESLEKLGCDEFCYHFKTSNRNSWIKFFGLSGVAELIKMIFPFYNFYLFSSSAMHLSSQKPCIFLFPVK